MNSAASKTEYLRITDLHSYYGESHILHGIDMKVDKGECVTLLGRNGSGRSTTLKSIMGLVGRRSGSIMLNGTEIINVPTHKIAHHGVGFCPEERAIFSSLSTEENLTLAPIVASGGMTDDEIYEMFPNLKERRNSPGTKLSGGEQQMLAMARVLVGNPKLLLIDEPTEGLAPMVVAEIFQLMEKLKKQGISILLIEQNIHKAIHLCDRHYVVERGSIVLEGNSKDAADRNSLIERVSV